MASLQERFDQKPTIPPREKREYPKIELGNPEDYKYFSQKQVSSVLSGFGYGENMMRVHALYLHKDNSKAVGVWHAQQEEGHFIGNPVLRGMEEGEAIGQTLLVALTLADKIPQDKKDKNVRLVSIGLEYRNPGIPPFDFNTVVLFGEPEKEHEITGYGEVRCGGNILSQAYVSGSLLEYSTAEAILQRTRRRQQNAVTLFPFQG